MGVLLQKKDFLEEVGFKKENDYYWNKFTINDLYDLYVEVNLDKKELLMMIEYECGGEITSYNEFFYSIETESELLEWLDEEITDEINLWKGM